MTDYTVIFEGGKIVQVEADHLDTAPEYALKELWNNWDSTQFKDEHENYRCAVICDETNNVSWYEVYLEFSDPSFYSEESDSPHENFPELDSYLQGAKGNG